MRKGALVPGAHVAAVAGARLGGALARVTGLDPAGPCFDHRPPEFVLDDTDAQFVDVIHSAGAPRDGIFMGLGLLDPLGHIDFYPNDGKGVQPGCSWRPGPLGS